ncbi:glycoside hydrolase family 81 protein [Schizophyllum commune]
MRSFLFLTAAAAVKAVVFGPIGTDRPAPAGGEVASDQPPNSFFQGLSPPYPTNDWWVGFAAGDGNATCAGPFPYESVLTASAVQFGISTSRDFDGTSVHQPTQMDWGVSFSEHSGSVSDHKALGWDRQTVTVQYFTGSATMNTYLVPGSPYMTFEYSGATPKFTSGQGLITSFANTTISEDGSTTANGTEFLVTNDAGTYVIYSLGDSISFTATAANGAGTIVASAPFTGVLRVVKLSEDGHKTLLDAHHSVYPTSVDTSYSFSGDSATMTFNWNVSGGNGADLLMLTWPHHRIKLQSPNFPDTSALSYLTTKGYMYPALGNQWNMQYDLSTITWNAPRAPDSSCQTSLVAGLEYEIAHLPEVAAPGDFYWFGGHVGMVSRLALIAEVMNRNDLADTVITYLKAMYAFWFDSSSTTTPAYETAWGGIINKAGYNNVNVDYGNGYYNDHHFHYGYFLAAAAVIAKFDAGWLNTYRTQVDAFLRDIVNPSPEDPYFPVTRNRDWFAGHSWASGIANGAGSRDQESVGEAVNGYYGSMLWALVSGNTDVYNYARMLLAQEQHAAQVYWHMYPSQSSTDRDQPYPEQGLRDLVTIGNVQDWQAGAWLFWGDQKVEIAAIQILPVTPVNEYMYDAEWVNAVWNYTSDELTDATYSDDWKSVIYLAYANANAGIAAQRSSALTSWGSGNSYSNQMYFLATRSGASGVCDASNLGANPLGNYTLQVDASGQYVGSTPLPDLVANSTQADAVTFTLGFAPNAGTLQAGGQYVTADSSGTYTLSANRATASAWEIFVIRQKQGAATGVYSIMAASNKQYVVVGADGTLKNNGATEGDSTGFRLVAA